MMNKSTLSPMLKIALPFGFLVALCWIFIQLSFFNQGWAQPGTTSLSLFFTQAISVFLFLLISFRWYRDRFLGGFVSFGRLMVQGILTGIFVVVFGVIIFQIYVNFINPAHFSWLEEMYNLSWTQRGYTETEIQSQQATNDWLNSPAGFVYSIFFVIGLMAFFSILPALLTMRSKNNTELLIMNS